METEELVQTLRSYQNKIDANPNRLNWVNERLSLITKLKRKYGNTPEEIYGYLKTRKETLQSWEALEESITSLENDLIVQRKQLDTQAENSIKNASKQLTN